MTTKDALYNFCLRLADNQLVLAQRLAEWCSRGPILEEDLAMTNISLDLFGQAESFYEYAAGLKDNTVTADHLAFLRSEREYYNNLLVELPNGDFAQTMLKQFLYASFCKYWFEAMSNSNDTTIQGLCTKAVKELNYHLMHSAEWLIRLGNGTDESHRRCQKALDLVWRYTADLFVSNAIDEELSSIGISVKPESIQDKWMLQVKEVLQEAGLNIPDYNNKITGGCNGIHTEYLGHLLTEMQYLQRAHPGATW